MPSRLVPCSDCATEKRRLERAGFIVNGCVPEGSDGMCRIAFTDKGDAQESSAGTGGEQGIAAVQGASSPAGSSTPSAAVPAAMPAAVSASGLTSQAWDGSVPLAATAVVKRIEGFFAAPYDDNGAQPGGTWTIGYGTIVDAGGNQVTPSTSPISEVEAEKLLQRDMEGAARDVQLRVKVPLAICEAAALISWTYNLGGGSLGKSTMLMRINAGAKGAVPPEMRRWINHEGKPLVGLLRRRWAEAAIFIGIDPTNACVRAWREIDSLEDWPDF